MPTPFQRASPPARPQAGPALWFPFRNHAVIVENQASGLALIQGAESTIALLEPHSILYLGTLNGVPCMACEVSSEITLPNKWLAIEVRTLLGQFDSPTISVLGYASQLLRWQREHRYCPVSGHLLGELSEQWSRHCPDCSYVGYPPVTPAILVLVHNGEHVLLAHKAGWGTRYSVIAGFVEPGETLEECVAREVMEEVGVEITEITYVSNQPWPFPTQLMIGFTARYANGEIQPDQQEIDLAAWFRFDQLPDLPPPLSLARQLIMQWVATQEHAQ